MKKKDEKKVRLEEKNREEKNLNKERKMKKKGRKKERKEGRTKEGEEERIGIWFTPLEPSSYFIMLCESKTRTDYSNKRVFLF